MQSNQQPLHGVVEDSLSLDHEADQPRPRLRFSPGLGAVIFGVALCIGFVLALGWSSQHIETLETAKASLKEETARLKTALGAVSSEGGKTIREATAANTEVQQLRRQLSSAEQARDLATEKLVAAQQELDQLAVLEISREKEIGRLRLFLKSLSGFANDQQTRVQEAIGKTDSLLVRLRDTEHELTNLAKERAALTEALGQAEQDALETESWTGRLMTSYVRSEVEKKQIAKQLVSSKAESRRLSQAFTRLREEAWVEQVVRYYSLYGGQPAERHLVEVSAEEHDHIKSWLGDQIGEPIRIPDLSEEGLTFVGARLLDIQGAPAGQLTYLDSDRRPVVICMWRGSTDHPGFADHRNGDTRLVEWQEQKFRYIVVGDLPQQRLTTLARFIRDTAPSI